MKMETKNEMQAVQPAIMPVLTEQKLNEFLDIAGVATQLTPKEKKNFVEIAQAYGLSPFKREIYCTTYGQGQYRKTSIITGYEVYIKRAERTGKLNGWGVEIKNEKDRDDMSAVITIYRKDWDRPFVHEAFFEECAQKTKEGNLNSIWAKMPKFMLRKVAIAQGFRLCFSDELGGMPYTADELPEGEIKAQYKGETPQAKAEVVDAVPLELSPDDMNRLDCCANRAELKAVCIQLGKEVGAAYEPILNGIYREKAKGLNK
jgi:phage recombination protein Bet